MPLLWCPEAIQDQAASTNGKAINGSARLGGWPKGSWRYIPFDRAARVLENPAGGVETSRYHTYQIKVAGFANHALSLGVIRLLKKSALWLKQAYGVPRTCTSSYKAYPERGKANKGERLSRKTWGAYSGWGGHQQVPENGHGIPGYPWPIEQILS